MEMSHDELVSISLGKLKMRFDTKIDFNKYYLSYSGGKDSHLLYWFIKEYLHDNIIPIVGVNTYREHSEIKDRIYKNCDTVLTPVKTMLEIKENYGIPCFTKNQDGFISKFQSGNWTRSVIERIYGIKKSIFNISEYARTLLLNDNLHLISNECCKYTKKEPLHIYGNETNLFSIIGVRGDESKMRHAQYQTCINKNNNFTPLYDFNNEMINALYLEFNIEIPKIYNQLNRTGCIGCPYAKKALIEEWKIITPAQKQFAIESFKDSYKVLNFDYIIGNFIKNENDIDYFIEKLRELMIDCNIDKIQSLSKNNTIEIQNRKIIIEDFSFKLK